MLVLHLHGGPLDGNELPVGLGDLVHTEEIGHAVLTDDRPENDHLCLRGLYEVRGLRYLVSGPGKVPIGLCLQWRGWVSSHERGVN